MSKYTNTNQERHDCYDGEAPRSYYDRPLSPSPSSGYSAHYKPSKHYDSRYSGNRLERRRPEPSHPSSSSRCSSSRRSSLDRDRSSSPPTASSRPRAPKSSRESGRQKENVPSQVEVWTGHSYKKSGAGYIIGIGLEFEFDDGSNSSVRAAILSATGRPSHHAELMAIMLTLTALTLKKMGDCEVFINSNQAFIVSLINKREEPSPDGQKRGYLATSVYDFINDWPRPVFLNLGVSDKDLAGMKAAKLRAVSVRQEMEQSPEKLRQVPDILSGSVYGFNRSYYFSLTDPKHSDGSYNIVAERSTIAAPPDDEYRGPDTPPKWQKDPSSSSRSNPTASAAPPNNLQKDPSSSSHSNPTASAVPPNNLQKDLPSSSHSNPTASAAPPNWPAGIPYPIPFELAGELIAQLISITAPPTPEEMERLTPRANPIPMPPQTPQQQHQQPAYYAAQAPYIPSAPPSVPVYHHYNQPTPPLLTYLAGSSYQPYHSSSPHYPPPHQQLAVQSPIYPPGSDPVIQSPGPPSSESTEATLPDPRLDPRLHAVESPLASVLTPSLTPPPPPTAQTTTYGTTIIYPTRTGLINTVPPALDGSHELLRQQPPNIPRQDTPPQTSAFPIDSTHLQ